jgi:phospholipid/cholesterol/gamma-HCH transport system substrate-binding protein
MSLAWRIRHQLLGMMFVAVMVIALAFAVMIYQKKFTSVVMVQLTADSIGNQLLPESDVKLNGLIVGEVRTISHSDGKAQLVLALQPDKVNLIPANVTARFLPKTLFGDKYISLVMPDQRGAPIASGDVIKQDTSQSAVEVQRVLDDLLPLLRAVRPQDLSATLGAMVQGLDGRGSQLGRNLSQLNTLVSSVNKQLPALQADISGLADLTSTYTQATPDLITALGDLTTTSNTVVQQHSSLDLLYATLTGTSADLTGFLNANGANIIRLSTDSTSTLQLLARYAPEYQCMLHSVANVIPRVDQAMGVGTDRPGVRLKLELTKERGKYVPDQDEPNVTDNRGPRCYPILDPAEHPGVPNFPQAPGGALADGSVQPPSSYPDFIPGTVPPQPGYNHLSTDLGIAGSTSEQQMLTTIFAQTTDTTPDPVSGWSALVAAPALRGHEVSLG